MNNINKSVICIVLVIIFIAVFIGSPAAALYGLAASIFSAEISNLFGEPVEQIHMGLFGFNAVLKIKIIEL